MLDTAAEETADRRPAMLICVYDDADPAWPLNDTGLPTARMRSLGPDEPDALARRIVNELADETCRAVLLVGRSRKSDRFHVQLRAENRALKGGRKLAVTGPAVARATAPASEMVRAISDVGFIAEATSDSEDDAGSYLLYRILTALPDNADAAAIGLLRTPAGLEPEAARRGVEAAATAIARHLSPLPRSRFS
ncbi:MAG: hypothetical protein K2X61_01995 [Caulobacteraceae bacterium]|nr:hypothetical protein [Caulobacteraceae bacterium]